ncbi:unnamed protein product, partial [Brenthis ino]
MERQVFITFLQSVVAEIRSGMYGGVRGQAAQWRGHAPSGRRGGDPTTCSRELVEVSYEGKGNTMNGIRR